MLDCLDPFPCIPHLLLPPPEIYLKKVLFSLKSEGLRGLCV